MDGDGAAVSRGDEYPLLGPAARAYVDAERARQRTSAPVSNPSAARSVAGGHHTPPDARPGRSAPLHRRDSASDRPSVAPAAPPLAMPSADAGRPLCRPSYRAGTPEAMAQRRPVPPGVVRIAAIDPGLDRLSIAFFDARLGPGQHRYRAEPQVRAAAFTHVIYATTRPEAPMPERLAHVGRALAGELAAMRPAVVYVERPAVHGAYYRRDRGDLAATAAATARGLALMHQALGVVLAVCGEYAAAVARGRATVEVVAPARAFGATKEARLAYAALLLRTSPRACELPNADDRDAFALGVAQAWAL